MGMTRSARHDGSFSLAKLGSPVQTHNFLELPDPRQEQEHTHVLHEAEFLEFGSKKATARFNQHLIVLN